MSDRPVPDAASPAAREDAGAPLDVATVQTFLRAESLRQKSEGRVAVAETLWRAADAFATRAALSGGASAVAGQTHARQACICKTLATLSTRTASLTAHCRSCGPLSPGHGESRTRCR